MTMHTERLTAAVLDMWYGRREDWYDLDLSFEMNVTHSEPAKRDRDALDYIETYGSAPTLSFDWINDDRIRRLEGSGAGL
jgi:hypothetical protein